MAARVLIVDDVAVNRLLLAAQVQKLGDQTVVASDGLQALAILRSEPVDIVLLDINMPPPDGFAVLGTMRSDPVLRDLPVVIVSADSELDSVVQGLSMGAVDYLPKPFRPELLAARLTGCMSERRHREAERRSALIVEHERNRVDELLHNILPPHAARELKETNRVRPKRREQVALLFADVVGFTSWCGRHDPEQVLEALSELVEMQERIAFVLGLEKIKTMGDAFMGAAGLVDDRPDPVGRAVRAALLMAEQSPRLEPGWKLRIGVHVGPERRAGTGWDARARECRCPCRRPRARSGTGLPRRRRRLAR